MRGVGLISPGGMRIREVSLGLEIAHIRDGNGSGQKLNVIDIGIEPYVREIIAIPAWASYQLSELSQKEPEHVRY